MPSSIAKTLKVAGILAVVILVGLGGLYVLNLVNRDTLVDALEKSILILLIGTIGSVIIGLISSNGGSGDDGESQ